MLIGIIRVRVLGIGFIINYVLCLWSLILHHTVMLFIGVNLQFAISCVRMGFTSIVSVWDIVQVAVKLFIVLADAG